MRRTKKTRTTRPDPAAARHPDLVERHFQAEAPNQLWVADLERRHEALLNRVQVRDLRRCVVAAAR